MTLYRRLTVAQYILFGVCMVVIVSLAVLGYLVAFAVMSIVSVSANWGFGIWAQWYLDRQRRRHWKRLNAQELWELRMQLPGLVGNPEAQVYYQYHLAVLRARPQDRRTHIRVLGVTEPMTNAELAERKRERGSHE